MLFNSCDSARLNHGHDTCKLQPFTSNSYSAQLRPLGSAPNAQHGFQAGASNVDIYPAESYGLLQSQDGGRYFQAMLRDACNKGDYWRGQTQQQTPPEGYQVSPTYTARPSHQYHPSLAISHLQWNRNVPGYVNSTGKMVDYLYSSNAFPTFQAPQSHNRSEVGEEMAIPSNRNRRQGIVAMDNQAPLQLPLSNQRHYHQTLSGRDDLKCSEANPSSFLKYSSSSSLIQQHPISDNSIQITSGSTHSPQTHIKVESSFVSSLFRKTEKGKLDQKNIQSSSEDVVCMYSITSPSIDNHQRKSAKSTGRSLPYYFCEFGLFK